MNNLKTLFLYLTAGFVAACNPITTADKEDVPRSITGSWGFLDKTGNYNEAFFGDTAYFTYNKIYGLMPTFAYKYHNDTLWSTIDRRKPGLSPVAAIEWVTEDMLVIVAERTRDTLERISGAKVDLGNTDPVADSVLFREAFTRRYEEFLVNRGILTRQEIEDYKRDSIIPDDVREKSGG